MTDTEKVADKIIAEEEQDIVLEARKNKAGQLKWRIPTDLAQAAFLLKLLDLAVSAAIKGSLQIKQPIIQKPKIDLNIHK